MVSGLVKENRYLEDCLVEWLTATNGDAVMLSLNARRAAICVLGRQEGKFDGVFEIENIPIMSTAEDSRDDVLYGHVYESL